METDLFSELVEYSNLESNWDFDGAAAPNKKSFYDATLFVKALGLTLDIAEPMIHSCGAAGLYLRGDWYHGEIEFLGDGKAAYYFEVHGKKSKGVLKLNFILD